MAIQIQIQIDTQRPYIEINKDVPIIKFLIEAEVTPRMNPTIAKGNTGDNRDKKIMYNPLDLIAVSNYIIVGEAYNFLVAQSLKRYLAIS